MKPSVKLKIAFYLRVQRVILVEFVTCNCQLSSISNEMKTKQHAVV